MKKLSVLIVAASCCLGLSSCGSIYSPSLHLAHDPIEKNHGQLTAAMSALPQTGLGNVSAAGCGEFEAAYGFSNSVSIEGKVWSQASEVYQGQYNGGGALSATIMLSSREADLPIAIIPSGSMLVENRDIKAMGAMVRAAMWLPTVGIFRPYVAAGPGFMASNFKQNDWGYGAVTNLGVSAKFSDHFSANLELLGALQQYRKYTTWNGYLAPTLSVSWAFDNE